METINNVATAAAKAVWGGRETNQEPLSGVQGNTMRGEPYDAGNMEPDKVQNIVTPSEEPRNPRNFDNLAFEASEVEPHDSKHVPKSPSVDAVDAVAGEKYALQSTGSGLENDAVPGDESKDLSSESSANIAEQRTREAPSADTSEGTGGHLLPATDLNKSPKERNAKSPSFVAQGNNFHAASHGHGSDGPFERDDEASVTVSGKPPGRGPSKQTSDGEKKSLKDRIKAKLHRH